MKPRRRTKDNEGETWRQKRKRLLLNMRAAANEIEGDAQTCGSHWAVTHCLTLKLNFFALFFLFFFSLPLQSESDVSHHLACLQRERVAGARRPTLGVSRVMLLPLWQSHIPPAARQLTGSHKSPQIGPKKATKAIFSRHKATGIK